MNEVTLREGLKAALQEAIRDAGVGLLKSTSMFPLTRRKADETKKAA